MKPPCAPLRYILSVSEGHPETARRIEAPLLWFTLGSPGGSCSAWMRTHAPDIDLWQDEPRLLTWREALSLAMDTDTPAGDRVRKTFQHPEAGPAVMLRLLGLARGEASPSA